MLTELINMAPPQAGQVMRLPACQGSADALLLGGLATRHALQKRLLVVITQAALDAQRLLDECRWFYPDLRVALLADWEIL
ncbi:MAG: hypothetical protein ACO26U_08415, partial [Burkholderiaceae bacterium]